MDKWNIVNNDLGIAELLTQSLRHFAWQSSMRVPQALRSSYLRHMTATNSSSDEYWHLNRTYFTNTLTYTHTTSRTLPNRDINLRSLTLPAPEDGEFMELILV